MTESRARSSATELRESMVAVTRQMRRHRPDHGLTLSQMEVLSEVRGRVDACASALVTATIDSRDSVAEELARDSVITKLYLG